MNKLPLLSLSLLLSACTVGPDYQAPNAFFMDKWFSSSLSSTAVVSQDPIDLKWWTIFNDPLLTKYIEQSAVNNKDVQIAIANVNRARAVRSVSGGSLFPSLGTSADLTRSQSSSANSSFTSGEIRDVYDADFDASWELDVFGGNRRSVEASNARVGSAIASYNSVMLSTFSEVARNYYAARGTQKRIDIINKNTDILKQTYELIQRRLDVGEATQFDLARAKGEYEATQSRLPNLMAELEINMFSLSV